MAKVVITGTGIISAAGIGTQRVLDAMASGINLFDNAKGLDTRGAGSKLPWPIAGSRLSDAPWPTPAPWPDLKKYANAAAQQAVAVASLAIEKAGPADDKDGVRCGTVLGSEGHVDELAPILSRLGALAENDSRPLATLLYEEVPDYSYLR
jgi:3-oxoacyl-[acyl-carrier-protein] synthase II